MTKTASARHEKVALITVQYSQKEERTNVIKGEGSGKPTHLRKLPSTTYARITIINNYRLYVVCND
jgi:hypothetical protein